MDDQVKLAYEFASDLSKQLITLSTAILALTATFTKDLLKTRRWNLLLVLAWIGYLSSLVFGIMSLMALTGELAPVDQSASSIHLGPVPRRMAEWQIYAFGLSTLAIVGYGTINLLSSRQQTSH